ncbi:MAG: hypothetical protein ACOY31_01060 [Bacillota bacterium]
MRIEILDANTERKSEIVTYLGSLEGFYASGGKYSAAGIEAEITEKYMYFQTALPWLADEIVKKLFTVSPAQFASSFFEIRGGPKIIVTCPARQVTEIISSLDIIEHLDLESGELAGQLETKWSSRDVSVAALYGVVVQGGVAVARVKFRTHFRDSEYNCRQVISMISLADGIKAFSDVSKDYSRPALISPVLLEAEGAMEEGPFTGFMNQCPGRTEYLRQSGEFLVRLEGKGNIITFSKKKQPSVDFRLRLEEPWLLDKSTAATISSFMKITDAAVHRKITGLTLTPEDLKGKLGFVKAGGFFEFRKSYGGFEISYDISTGDMAVLASIPWDSLNSSKELFSMIEDFTDRVMEFAV